ncbi:MAG: HIT domain-containing protein [Methylococcales bacterium]|nr:HIT domain-containing protein [Methylococcales bacterium]
MSFKLHSRLQLDSIEIGRFTLSQLLLINDSQYPWLVLVPERNNITEIYQLSEQDQIQLQRESCILAKTLAEAFKADKMNIAAIGNMVPQLHIHHIVRYKNDVAWPAPVWGKFDAIPYTELQFNKIKKMLLTTLKENLKSSV